MSPFSFIPSAFQQEEELSVTQSLVVSAPRKKGFTLVEIMVSVAILSLMILFLFSVFNMASQAWQSSEKKVDAFREARAAMFVMRRDLTGLQVKSALPLALNQNLVPNLESPVPATDELFMLSTLSPDSQGGNSASGELCSVGYYVGWATNSFYATNTSFSGQSFNLFRYFRSAESNFSNLTNFWTGFTPPGTLSKVYRDASTQPQSGDEVLARNVISFKIRPYYYDTVVTMVAGLPQTNTVLFGTNIGPAQNAVVFTNKPAFLDVSMVVINYASAAQLGSSRSTWNAKIAETGTNSIVNQNKQEFYMRVPLSP